MDTIHQYNRPLVVPGSSSGVLSTTQTYTSDGQVRSHNQTSVPMTVDGIRHAMQYRPNEFEKIRPGETVRIEKTYRQQFSSDPKITSWTENRVVQNMSTTPAGHRNPTSESDHLVALNSRENTSGTKRNVVQEGFTIVPPNESLHQKRPDGTKQLPANEMFTHHSPGQVNQPAGGHVLPAQHSPGYVNQPSPNPPVSLQSPKLQHFSNANAEFGGNPASTVHRDVKTGRYYYTDSSYQDNGQLPNSNVRGVQGLLDDQDMKANTDMKVLQSANVPPTVASDEPQSGTSGDMPIYHTLQPENSSDSVSQFNSTYQTTEIKPAQEGMMIERQWEEAGPNGEIITRTLYKGEPTILHHQWYNQYERTLQSQTVTVPGQPLTGTTTGSDQPTTGVPDTEEQFTMVKKHNLHTQLDDWNTNDSLEEVAPPLPPKIDVMHSGIIEDNLLAGLSISSPCFRCKEEFLPEEERVNSNGELWHRRCFVCAQCFRPFPDNLFYEFDGRKYCENDFHILFAPCCAKCGKFVIGRVLRAMDQSWHPACFCCANCNTELADLGFVKCNNQALCRPCYHREKEQVVGFFICHRCQTTIEESGLVFQSEHYHSYHFNCTNCNDELTSSAREVKGKLYCLPCHDKLGIPICGACRRPIEDRAVRAIGKMWHVEHFVCAYCEKPFHGHKYHERNGRAYCELHFNKLFGNNCFHCNKVMQGEIVHSFNKMYCVNHFNCCLCNKNLHGEPSKNCLELDMRPLCQKCYDRLPQDLRRRLYSSKDKKKRKLLVDVWGKGKAKAYTPF